jgi:hypothetical protein
MPGSLDYEQFLAGFGSATYPSLLAAQRAVLAAYAADFTERTDVGVELPTGAGKSLIALLIAEAWRCEGQRAVVLTANKALANQMEAHAQLLGVPVSRLEGSRDDIPSPSVRMINRYRAIGVMNYWVYFNQNPVLDVADLVVLDDVHLADGALQSLFSVEINRWDHPQLFQRVAEALGERLPGYPGIRDAADATDDPLSPTDLIAPHDHMAVIEQVSAIIAGSQPTGDLGFRWSRVRTHADAMHLYVTADQLVLRPYVWPLQEFAYYRDSTQRLYLSATLGSADDLQRRLGCRPVTLIPVPVQHGEPLGRRMIVLNEDREAAHVQAALNSAVAHQPKSLWLTRSHVAASRRREDLERIGLTPIWQLGSDGNEAAVFAAAAAGHLVCAGRYDGIDLPGDACRLVVVTDLPRAIDLQEQFLSEQLRDASFLLERLNARIIQALGRANRSRDDYAVYVLLDRRFAGHLQRDANRASLPARVNAEIDVAQDAAQGPAAALGAAVTAFLNHDFAAYDAAVSDAASAGPPLPPAPMPAVSAEPEVEGWRRMHVEDFVGAGEHFAAWAHACQQAGLREQAAFAYVCQARACLLAGRDGDLSAQARSRDLIERAIGAGGIRSTWFNGLRASVAPTPSQAAAQASDEATDRMLTTFDLRASADGGNRARFERVRARVAARLASRSHAEFQEGLEETGRLLGFDAVRPRGTGATDARWGWTEGGRRQLLLWEAKIEHVEHGSLAVSDVDQANGQLTAARTEFAPRGAVCRGAIVSHLEPDATAASRLGDITLVTKEAVLVLWERVAAVYARYLELWRPDDADARRQAVTDVERRLPRAGWLSRALDTHATLGATELLDDWP